MTQDPSDNLLRDILRKSRVFALVGVSPNPVRPSHFVGRYLGLKGYKVVPVNPGHAGERLWGQEVRASFPERPVGPAAHGLTVCGRGVCACALSLSHTQG